MTTFYVTRKNQEATIEVKGHANYAEYGNDIVCASVSSVCIYTANLIEKLKLSYNIVDLVCDDGYFRLQVKMTDPTSIAIFDNLEYTLEDISKQYPKYLKYQK